MLPLLVFCAIRSALVRNMTPTPQVPDVVPIKVIPPAVEVMDE